MPKSPQEARKELRDLVVEFGVYWILGTLADLVVEVATPKTASLARQLRSQILRARDAT